VGLQRQGRCNGGSMQCPAQPARFSALCPAPPRPALQLLCSLCISLAHKSILVRASTPAVRPRRALPRPEQRTPHAPRARVWLGCRWHGACMARKWSFMHQRHPLSARALCTSNYNSLKAASMHTFVASVVKRVHGVWHSKPHATDAMAGDPSPSSQCST